MKNYTVNQLKKLDKEELTEYVNELGMLHSQFRLRIGKVLWAVKDKLGVKEYTKLYEETFGIDSHAANRYMRVAMRYADSSFEDMGYSAQLKLTTLSGDEEMVKECRKHFEEVHLAGGKVTAMAISGWVDAYKFAQERTEEYAAHEEEQVQANKAQENAAEVGAKFREQAEQAKAEHEERMEERTKRDTKQHDAHRELSAALLTLGLGQGTTEETTKLVYRVLVKELSKAHPEQAGNYAAAGTAIANYYEPAPVVKLAVG
jgi:hypothetical protein